MISIDDLCKSYGSRTLFCHFSITIEQGEFVVFNGESGAGKTTLLNMIGGLEPFDSGRITIDGLDVTKRKERLQIFREKVGFLFQNFALVEKKTVMDNLNMIESRYRKEVSIADVLAKVGMEGSESRYVYSLSGGEQQRIAIARLLLKKSSIILADEPTGSLDKRNADEIMGLLLQLNEEGHTVIMVTHNDEYKKYGGRMITL